MKSVYAHFPINVAISDEKTLVEVRNFLGEKYTRRVQMLPGVTCAASGQKDEFVLEGNDIELVSRSGEYHSFIVAGSVSSSNRSDCIEPCSVDNEFLAQHCYNISILDLSRRFYLFMSFDELYCNQLPDVHVNATLSMSM